MWQVTGDVAWDVRLKMDGIWGWTHLWAHIKTTLEKFLPEELAIKAIFVAFKSISGWKQAQINKITPLLYVKYPNYILKVALFSAFSHF